MVSKNRGIYGVLCLSQVLIIMVPRNSSNSSSSSSSGSGSGSGSCSNSSSSSSSSINSSSSSSGSSSSSSSSSSSTSTVVVAAVVVVQSHVCKSISKKQRGHTPVRTYYVRWMLNKNFGAVSLKQPAVALQHRSAPREHLLFIFAVFPCSATA